MKIIKTAIPITAIAALLASCANPSHLVVYQHSNLGMNAGMSPATNNFHVRIGLRREFAAVVPKYDEMTDVPELDETGAPVLDANGNPKTKKTSNPDAASAFIAGRMRVRSPFRTPEVTECIASGQAAINAANGTGLPRFITALAAPTTTTATTNTH